MRCTRVARGLAIFVVAAHLWGCVGGGEGLTVGSKKFTENVVLGEVARLALVASGETAEHRQELGGTRILWRALREGAIDVYPEYTGTLTQEILRDERVETTADMALALANHGIAMTPPLGFNNSYALGMRPQHAAQLGLRMISDLVTRPDLRFGLTNEFLDRGDGWPGLRRRYGLPQQNVRGLDHAVAYRALDAGEIDVMDLYTTDAEIAYYGLQVLEDDRAYFPRYEALFLYRIDRADRVEPVLRRLVGQIDEPRMRALNARVKLEGAAETVVASEVVTTVYGAVVDEDEDDRVTRLYRATREHLTLVAVSMAGALVVALPLGILAARRRRLGQVLLAAVGVVQTIPALALLVFMIPLLGIYEPPAIAALFLYSLLPIVRNTHAGLVGIAPELRESAIAIGLPVRARLWQVELPLALPSILAGVKTATVINIGFATLGALIGAGGYGQPILTGIRLDDLGLILEGAVPAAVMALLAQAFFEWLERALVPRGLRLG